MMAPPTNWASANCQPINSQITNPIATLRLVEANMKIIDAVKSADRANNDRASALAAYEHDELAAPSSDARVADPTVSRPSTRCIARRETNACTIPDSANPTTSAHNVSHNI